MYTDFQNISDNARIWIYQSDRKLTKEEILWIDDHMKRFIEKWTAHGNDLYASARVEHNHFLIIALDEDVGLASGCSIDASVHFLKELEQHLKVSFFDRSKVAFQKNDDIELVPVNKLRDKIEIGEITENDITFNHLIPHKLGLDKNWMIRAGESWLKKYFSQKNTTV
jgi:hypothetical protein